MKNGGKIKHGPAQEGFSLAELLIVVCIVGILIGIAAKQYQIYKFQAKVAYGVGIASIIQNDLMEYYMYFGKWPETINELPSHPEPVSEDGIIKKVDLEKNGVINVWFQNIPGHEIDNPVLTIRPALSKVMGSGTITWICGTAEVPGNAMVWGEDKTNIPENYLISSCR